MTATERTDKDTGRGVVVKNAKRLKKPEKYLDSDSLLQPSKPKKAETVTERMARQRAAREARDGSPDEQAARRRLELIAENERRFERSMVRLRRLAHQFCHDVGGDHPPPIYDLVREISEVAKTVTAALSKKSDADTTWVWMQSMVDKDKWTTARIPEGECMAASIKRSSKNSDGTHTYFINRDGKYVDCCNDLEEAKKIARSGKMRPERRLANEKVRAYIKHASDNNRTGDLDMFKALSKEGQAAILMTYPHLAPRTSALKADAKTGAVVNKARRDLQSQSDKRSADLPDGKIVRLIDKNPKRAGTDAHVRWELMFGYAGRTVAEYVGDKNNPTTLKNAIKAGYVKVA
jgi:hypothetical protein